MAELNFPDSPSVNDTYTSGGRTWTWNGETWIAAQDLGGSNTEVLFNDSDVIGSDVGFTYDKVSNNVFMANTLNLGHATDTTISRSAAGVIAVEGADVLMASVADVLTAGFATTIDVDGVQDSGTYTPVETTGNFKSITANGAFTLGVPANDSTMIIQVTNGTSAGTITTSSYTIVTGDALTTTSGDDFLFYITNHGSFSHLEVTALQ